MPDTDSRSTIGPVLLVTPWYPPTIGGVAVVVQRLGRLLAAAGAQVSVWVCNLAGESPAASSQDGCEVVYRWVPSTAFYELTPRSLVATLVRAPATLWHAWRFVRKRRIETVVLAYPIGNAWPFVVLRWLGGVKLISACYGNEVLTFARGARSSQWLFRRVLAASDAVVVSAAHLSDAVSKLLPRRALPVWLIPVCIDDSYFCPRPDGVTKDERLTLIHVSAFTPRKRTLDIVRAFALARVPHGTRLLMVGEGPERQAAQDLAVQLDVADRVHFTGAPHDVRPFLWDSDLLVMASDEESGPLTLLEAMACEIPWIMTPWGIAMTLPENEYGAIVPARQPAELARAMETMLSDRPRLRAMGQRGRRKVLDEFGQKTNLGRHLQLIRAVEAGQGHRAVDFSTPARSLRQAS